MTADVKIIQLQEQKSMSIRMTVPNDQIGPSVGMMYGELMGYLMKNGLVISGAPFVYYHSYDMEKTDMEAGFPVMEFGPAEGRVKQFTLPGVKAANTTHVGPYDRVMDAYIRIQKFMEEKKLVPGNTMWEYYLNDPQTVDSSELITDVYWPVN